MTTPAVSKDVLHRQRNAIERPEALTGGGAFRGGGRLGCGRGAHEPHEGVDAAIAAVGRLDAGEGSLGQLVGRERTVVDEATGLGQW